jgi:hypothetical protein
MTIPGFSAEATLGGARGLYLGHNQPPIAGHQVILADWVDQACLAGCLKDCGLECAGMSGTGKAGCIHMCMRDNEDCRRSCTRPSDLPGGSTGGGSSPCGSGTPCAGGCCPPGFPACVFSGTAAVCCPAGFTHAVTIFGVSICLP